MSLQSREKMISLHNTQSDSAAVALITKSIQQGPPGSLSPDKAHVVPDVWRGGRWMHLSPKPNILRFPWCPFLHPPPAPPSPHPFVCVSLCLYLSALKAHHGLSRPAQDKFCLHWDGRGEPRARTKDAFIVVGSGWLRTDNGHILQLLKQIAVCSLLW